MTETDMQLERVMVELEHTKLILYITIALAIVLGIVFLYLRFRLRLNDKQSYIWENPLSHWLNSTKFVHPPRVNQVFWADGSHWVIVDVDVRSRRLTVEPIDETDILKPISPTRKGEQHVG